MNETGNFLAATCRPEVAQEIREKLITVNTKWDELFQVGQIFFLCYHPHFPRVLQQYSELSICLQNVFLEKFMLHTFAHTELNVMWEKCGPQTSRNLLYTGVLLSWTGNQLGSSKPCQR